MTDRELLECLNDRPCDACKFHSDKGCSKWDCVFDSKKALEQEPCEDAISRQAAIDAFQMFREYESNRNNKEWVDRIETVLNQLPPVNPKESCGDAISRQATIEAFQMFRGYEANRTNAEWVDRIETIVKKLPSVMQEPKTGHWFLLDECSNSGYYCSECKKKVVKEGWSDTVKKIKFCPNCGARMVEPQESEE